MADRNPKKTVMIIDDDKATRELIGRKLKEWGYRTISCGEAEAAFDCFREEAPHLVCLDLALPTRSGFEVCEYMRADPCLIDIPVLVITARTGLEDHARAIEVGADEILDKPFRFNDLETHVQHLIRHGRLPTETAGH